MAHHLRYRKPKRFNRRISFRIFSKNRFFIEYRACGKMRLQILELRSKLNRLFPEIYHKGGRFVSHITLVPPIVGHINQKVLLDIVKEACSKYKLVEFKISGYSYFDNDEKVIFAKISPSKEVLAIREYIFKKLKNIVDLKNDYEKTEGFNPHITLGWVGDKKSAERIIDYLHSNHPLDVVQIMDRITIMNGERILWEYDIYNKQVLSRNEALKHDKRLRNIRQIIESKGKEWQNFEQKHPEFIVKLTLWDRIKSFFKSNGI